MIKTIAFGLFIAGCSSNHNCDDVYTGPVHGKISGVVTTTDGFLQGASVSAQDVCLQHPQMEHMSWRMLIQRQYRRDIYQTRIC